LSINYIVNRADEKNEKWGDEQSRSKKGNEHSIKRFCSAYAVKKSITPWGDNEVIIYPKNN
jgi:hypothetical protein